MGKQWLTLFFWGSKITADGHCSHEIKRRLLLGRKVMTNLDSVLKNRDITLSTKVCLVKAMVFPVVMYRCESWTIKKTEHRRIDTFELWCWRLLRVTWTARRSNQSILKEISPGCSLDWCWSWNSNTLATWCEKLTHLKRPWCWERLKAGGEGDDREWDGWMASLTQWTWVWVNSGSWWSTGKPGMLWSMGSLRVRHDWLNSTELNIHVVKKEMATHSSIFLPGKSLGHEEPGGLQSMGLQIWTQLSDWPHTYPCGTSSLIYLQGCYSSYQNMVTTGIHACIL